MAVSAEQSLRPRHWIKRTLSGPVAKRLLVAVMIVGFGLWTWVLGVSAYDLLALAIRGLMLAAILALGAIGITLVYGVLKFPNFSHGDIMALGAYIALPILALVPQSGPLYPFSFGIGFIVALLIGMPVVGLVSYAIDRVIYRRLRAQGSGLVILAMASLGMAFFIRSVIYLAWGPDFTFYYIGRPRTAFELLPGIPVRYDVMFIAGLALAFVVAIYFLLEKTRMGKAMRAVSDNAELARVSGINTERVIMWTWVIGGALAAAGGIMYGLNTQLRPNMGFFLVIPLFAAVIVGTIGNAYGALLGALIVGIAWQVSTAYIDPSYAPGAGFFVMIIVLLIRPQGIFGKRS